MRWLVYLSSFLAWFWNCFGSNPAPPTFLCVPEKDVLQYRIFAPARMYSKAVVEQIRNLFNDKFELHTRHC